MISVVIATFMLGSLPIQAPQPTTQVATEYHAPLPIVEKINVEPLTSPTTKKLDKLKPIPIKKPKAPHRAVKRAPVGWYPKGQCTYWVWTKRPVPAWNDATDWKWQAKRDGWTVTSKPVVGAIAWEYGHVAYVEKVNSSTVTISEMNVKGLGVVSYRTVPTREFSYIY